MARALTVVPFVLPTVVVGSAFLALLGPRSPLNAAAEAILGPDVPQVRLDGSAAAIVIAHVFYNVAVVVRLVGGLWEHLDARTEEAARVLGASPWRAFREVTWPLLRPAVISAASIVFLFTVTSFGVVLLLGGPRDTTLEVEIYRQTAILLDLPTAAALTILQMAGVLVLLLASARAQERLAVQQRLCRRRQPRRDGRGPAASGWWWPASSWPRRVFMLTPLAGPGGARPRRPGRLRPGGVRGAAPGGPAHAPARRHPSPPSSTRSLFAVATTLMAGSLGLLAAAVVGYRRGWLLAVDGRPRHAAAGHLRGHRRLRLPGLAGHAAHRPAHLHPAHPHRPLAHRAALRDARRGAGHPLHRRSPARGGRGAGRLAGARLARGRRADPGARRAGRAPASPSPSRWASSGPRSSSRVRTRVTIPVAIFRLLGQPGAANFATAMALATVLMVLSAAAVLLIERLRGRGPQPF